MKNFFFLLALLLITTTLLIAVSIYFFLKYQENQKYLLPFYSASNKEMNNENIS